MNKFVYDFNDKTKLLPLLDAYIMCQLSQNYSHGLEIGVYKGGWIFTLKKNVSNLKIDAIDPYPGIPQIKQSFLEEARRLGILKDIQLFPTWDEYFKDWSSQKKYQIVHLDGEHSQSEVKKDLSNISALLSNDGVIVIDDIFYHSYPGVTAAAFDFLQDETFRPFLFTDKKLYICRTDYYGIFYKRTIDLLTNIKIGFEEDEQLIYSKRSYPQSNSLNGSSLIITQQMSQKEIIFLTRTLKLKPNLTVVVKEALRSVLSPIILVGIQKILNLLKRKQH